MTRRQVWQYRCDHCGKRNLSAASISKHEKHCCKNPDRICRMCIASKGEQKPLAELVDCIDASKDDYGMSRLREVSGNCPACMLAGVVNSTLHAPGCRRSEVPFSFKQECKAWWDEFNTVQCEKHGYY